jgi:hypothetical protein
MEIPVAQGFGTTVLRRLSIHSLEGQHWQRPKVFISHAICSCTGQKWGFNHATRSHPGCPGSGSVETRSGTTFSEPHGLPQCPEVEIWPASDLC